MVRRLVIEKTIGEKSGNIKTGKNITRNRWERKRGSINKTRRQKGMRSVTVSLHIQTKCDKRVKRNQKYRIKYTRRENQLYF